MTLSVGTYRTDITPAIGCSLQGSFEDIRSTEILDPLYANALVLGDGVGEFAIVAVDTCELHRHNVEAIAAGIEKTCGIPKEHVILAASHTHNGPPTGLLITDIQPDPVYVEHFRRQVISAVQMAQKRKQPVRMGVGQAENRKHVFHRRLRKPDGSIVMNWIAPEYLADTVPAGPVDAQMIVLRFEDEAGNPLAFIINYANHNNAAGGRRISADISGYIGRLLRKLYGEDLGVIFLLGACGNTNWVDWRSPERWQPHHFMDIATGLTGTVLEISAELEYPAFDRLSLINKVLRVPERPYRDFDTQVDDTFGGEADVFFKVYQEAR